MRIEQLTRDDSEAYIAFRQQMWPIHDAAGYWEVVQHKYFLNPHAKLCPGSGLYACFNGSNNICGIVGAYPMPVTLDGKLYPGHMLVDWAVHPSYWTGPQNTTGLQGKYCAGKLFAEFVALPGMKFASHGAPYSQIALKRKALKIPARVAASILSPVNAVLLEMLRLRGYASPSPISSLPFALSERAYSVPPDNLPTAIPASLQGTAYVDRNKDFWQFYFKSRCHHGVSALLLHRDGESGHIVLNILDCGRFRFAVLLALHLPTPNPVTARRLGVSAKEALRKMGIDVIIATEADDCIRAFLGSLGRYVAHRSTHWWSIPKSTDSFCAETVHWWLTSAERDAIWWPGSHVPPVFSAHRT